MLDKISAKIDRIYQRFPADHPGDYFSGHFRPQCTNRNILLGMHLVAKLFANFCILDVQGKKTAVCSLTVSRGLNKMRVRREKMKKFLALKPKMPRLKKDICFMT